MGERRLQPEKLDFTTFTIPPKPQVLLDLDALLNKKDVDFNEVGKAICSDIALSSYTLRIVNSPAWGLKKKISSIEQACVLLGLNRLNTLITTVALKNCFPAQDNFVNRVWESSMNVGKTAKALAQFLNLKLIDDVYTLCLFRDVGKIIIYQKSNFYTEVLNKAYAQEQLTVSDYETKKIGISHDVCSYKLAEKWLIPAHICNVIAFHHSPAMAFEFGEKKEKSLMAILKISEHVNRIHSCFSDCKIDYEWNQFMNQNLNAISLSQSDLVAFIKSYSQ